MLPAYEANCWCAKVDAVLKAIDGLGGRLTSVVASVRGVDHPYQLLSNETAEENLALRWVAGAGGAVVNGLQHCIRTRALTIRLCCESALRPTSQSTPRAQWLEGSGTSWPSTRSPLTR